MATIHKVISIRNDKDLFEQELNKVSQENNVFASHTHIFVGGQDIYYTAVVFCR